MEDINEKTPKKTLTPTDGESSAVVRIDFNHLKRDLGGFVRSTVEEALGGLLDAEAESICRAGRYERSNERAAHRSAMGVQWGQVKSAINLKPIRPVPHNRRYLSIIPNESNRGQMGTGQSQMGTGQIVSWLCFKGVSEQ